MIGAPRCSVYVHERDVDLNFFSISVVESKLSPERCQFWMLSVDGMSLKVLGAPLKYRQLSMWLIWANRSSRWWYISFEHRRLMVWDVVQGGPPRYRSIFSCKNRSSRWPRTGFLFRALMVWAPTVGVPLRASNHQTYVSHDPVCTNANTISIGLLKIGVCHWEHPIIKPASLTSQCAQMLIPSALEFSKQRCAIESVRSQHAHLSNLTVHTR
jgi:hypothetical protein